MATAKLIKELVISTPNEVGQLAKVCAAIRQCGANITHLCASALGADARFMMGADQLAKVAGTLEDLEYEVKEVEVIEIMLGNTPGTLEPVAQALAEANIDIEYSFATVADGKLAACIMSTNDNPRAVQVIND